MLRTFSLLALVWSAEAFTVRTVAPRSPSRASAACMATGNDAVTFGDLDGSEVRIGIITCRWHTGIINDLSDGVKKALKEADVPEDNIVCTEVPGSFELPLACRQRPGPLSPGLTSRGHRTTHGPARRYLALSGTVDAIVPVARPAGKVVTRSPSFGRKPSSWPALALPTQRTVEARSAPRGGRPNPSSPLLAP